MLYTNTSRYLLFSRILILFVSPCGCWPTENVSRVYIWAHTISERFLSRATLMITSKQNEAKQQKPICRSICFQFSMLSKLQNTHAQSKWLSDSHTMTRCMNMYMNNIHIVRNITIEICGEHVVLSCFQPLNIMRIVESKSGLFVFKHQENEFHKSS